MLRWLLIVSGVLLALALGFAVWYLAFLVAIYDSLSR